MIAQPEVVRHLRYVECAQQVDVDDGFEPVRSELADRDGEVSGGIVDDDVELTERLQYSLDGLRHLIVTADIAYAVRGLNPRLPQRRNRRLKIGFLSAADRDASTVAAQYPGDLQTEPGSAAGNQCHPPPQEVVPERTRVGDHDILTDSLEHVPIHVGKK